MGKSRTPKHIQLLQGVDKKNPNRVNHDEPISGSLGSAPEYFKSSMVSIWNEVISELSEGLLQSSDRKSLEVMCVLIYEFRKSPLDFPTMKITAMKAMFIEFGMTPVARTKISLPKKVDDNPFKDFD